MIAAISNEAQVLRSLEHPNVVKLLDFDDNAVFARRSGSTVPVVYFALELANKGELFDFVAETGRFNENIARYYFHQL